jgi:hypothetical protein
LTRRPAGQWRRLDAAHASALAAAAWTHGVAVRAASGCGCVGRERATRWDGPKARGRAGWAAVAVPRDGLGEIVLGSWASGACSGPGAGGGTLGCGVASVGYASALGRGCAQLAAQGGSGVGLGRRSWAAHCRARKRALASGLGRSEQASKPGKQTEHGGRRNCAGLAGERKEVELDFFLFSSLDYFFYSYSYLYTRKSYKLNRYTPRQFVKHKINALQYDATIKHHLGVLLYGAHKSI